MSNEILLVLLGIAVFALAAGSGAELGPAGMRVMRAIAAVLGLVVVLAALLR
jgi:hypothetical protein